MAGIIDILPDSLLKYAPPMPVKKPLRAAKATPHEPLYRDIRTGDEVLDIVLPPRHFEGEHASYYYLQRVSRTPATERDTEKLRQDLDRRMFERGARMAGPCVIRRELYSQALDELIREETIACAETGVLLAAWRDHCARNLTAYEALYVSRLTNENEKFLKLAQRKLQLRARVAELAGRERDVGLQVTRAEARLLHAGRARAERAALDAEKQRQEVDSLREGTAEDMAKLKAKLKEMKSGM